MSPVSTAILMGVLFLAIAGFDWYLYKDGKDGNTYSEVTTLFGKVWPPFRLLISVGFGLLLGHWFW